MILVLSGTRDGREIVERLLNKGYKVISTTATKYGGKLFENHPNLKVVCGKLNQQQMEELIKVNKVELVIDATHPYAIEVSTNIIGATKISGIKYVRYERKSVRYDGVKGFDDFEDVCKWLKNKDGNILLTTGSNNVDTFVSELEIYRLYARVLPTPSVVEKCHRLGLLPKQIIALQGPFSKELNKAIYKQYDIKYLVTKDSGDIGGTREKIESALEMEIEVLLIERPKLDYGNVVNDIDGVILKF